MFPARDPTYRVSFPRLASGIRIRAVERGDPAAPPIVLVHGWGCTVYVFRYNMPRIADAGYRVIAFDLKGHGLSDKPAGKDEYTIDALVDHVREAFDALGLDRPVLAGHSLGGSLAYHFAARHPDRVRGLGLLAPAGLTGVPLMRLYRFLTPAALNPLFKHARSRLAVKIALRRVYGKRGHYTQRDVDEYLAPSQFADYAPAVRQLLHSYDWKAAKHRRLSVVETPAVGVWGSRDHMMPRDRMDIYKGLVPGIELHCIKDAGHVITEETPMEVDEMLLVLLNRVYSG
jgi:pimeloyl-ACP methyl ester carboxylesterase